MVVVEMMVIGGSISYGVDGSSVVVEMVLVIVIIVVLII